MKITCSQENLVDWITAASPVSTMHPMSDYKKIRDSRKRYFRTLRFLLCEIETCETNEQIQEVFKKYDVHFVNVDEIERVNLKEIEE